VWEPRPRRPVPKLSGFPWFLEQEGSHSLLLVTEQAAVSPGSTAAGLNVAAGRRGSAAAGGTTGSTRRSTRRGTSGSAAAGSHVAAVGGRGAAAGSHIAANRCRGAAGGFFLATVEQTGFSVHGAKATNHHSSGQSDPFHFSASPRKVLARRTSEANGSQQGGRGHPGNSVFGFLRSWWEGD
jgi:hypothetical protein